MARSRFYDIAILEDPNLDDALKVVPNPIITVYEPGSSVTPLGQTLYAGPTGGTTKTNPFIGGSDGEVEFWIDTQVFPSVKFDGSGAGLGVVTKHYLPTIGIAEAPVVTIPEVQEVLNVLEHGIVAAETVGVRAANTTALEALALTAFSSGKEIYFPPGSYGFNATALNPTSGSVALKMRGEGFNTILKFWGTSAHLFGLATNGIASIQRGYIRDLYIYPQENQIAGAALALGNVSFYTLDGVHILHSSSAASAYTALQLGDSGLSCNVIHLLNSTFENNYIHDNAPVVRVHGSTAQGELVIHNCLIRGPGTDASPNTKSVGIMFTNSATFDAFKIVDTNIGTCKVGIWIPAVTVVNGLIANTFIDAIEDFGIYMQSTSGKGVQNIQIENSWIVGKDLPIYMDAGTGGIAHINITGNKLHGDCLAGAVYGSNVERVIVANNIIEPQPAGLSAAQLINFAGTSLRVVITGNEVNALATTPAAIQVESTVTPVIVSGNLCAGAGISLLGATSAARVLGDNSIS